MFKNNPRHEHYVPTVSQRPCAGVRSVVQAAYLSTTLAIRSVVREESDMGSSSSSLPPRLLSSARASSFLAALPALPSS